MLYFLLLKNNLKIFGFTLGVLLFSVFFANIPTQNTSAQGAAPSTGPCYTLVDAYTIEYTNPTCQVNTATEVYKSNDGGITFVGDAIVAGSGSMTPGASSTAETCNPGTNEIRLTSGKATLVKQAKIKSGHSYKCGEVNSEVVNLVDWDGKIYKEDVVNTAEANKLYEEFGNTLDSLKDKWGGYVCSSTSSSDCGPQGWKNLIYQCWQSRWNRAGAGAANGSAEEKDATAKSGFSYCLAEKIGNENIDPSIIASLIEELNFNDIDSRVTQAGDAAAEAVIAESVEQNPDDEETQELSSCGIEGLGWIVCPLMTFIGSLSDTAFRFLSTTFLETNVSYIQNDAVIQIWSIMRNIANVAFVIAFLIIIFSQLTGGGMSNYGVKKMLPRLVIAAILVNVSLYICLLAIDLSNILGYSINGMFDTVWNRATEGIGSTTDATGNGWGAVAIATGALAGGVTLLFAISAPVLLATFLALMLVVLILFARIALIFLLTIVSPLAFVAFLLPNTEVWFKKWYKMYFSLLIVFPVIAIVFGASSLAGGIIQIAAQSQPNGEILQVVAVGVAAIPLFVVPSLLKGSLSAAGSIGTKLSSMSSKLNGRVGSKVKDTSKLGAYSNAYKRSQQIKRAQITGGVYKGRNPLSRLSSNINSRINQSKLTGTMGTQVAQQAASMANKLQAENIEAAHAQIQQANMSTANLKRIADGGSANGINGKDNATRAAAMIQLKRAGKFDELAGSWDTAMSAPRSRENDETRRVVAQAFANSADRPGFMGQGVLADVARSENLQGKTLGELAAANGSKYSAEKLALTDHSELEYVIQQQVNINGGIQPELQYAAQKALNTSEIDSKITNNRGDINQLSGNAPLPPPTP